MEFRCIFRVISEPSKSIFRSHLRAISAQFSSSSTLKFLPRFRAFSVQFLLQLQSSQIIEFYCTVCKWDGKGWSVLTGWLEIRTILAETYVCKWTWNGRWRNFCMQIRSNQQRRLHGFISTRPFSTFCDDFSRFFFFFFFFFEYLSQKEKVFHLV